MYHFHPLKVTAVERVAEDAACVTLEIPATLRDAYAFHAGQYVTVRRMIEGREERRTYSIVTAPGGRELKLGIRHQARGRMSGELAAKLRPGDLLDVGTPMGRFRTAISAEGRRKLETHGIAPPRQSHASLREVLRGERPIACPRCHSSDTECISEFGSTPCKALHRCRACREPFEYFKCI